MLHAATNVHAWMNELTTGIQTTVQGMRTASSAMVSAASMIAQATRSMSGGITLNHNTNIANANLHNDLDINTLGEKMADTSMRRILSTRFSLNRAPIG
jgi:hypothetical protein